MSLAKAPVSLISRYVTHWQLEAARPIVESSRSTIFKVTCKGRPAALKLLHAHGTEDQARGIALMAWFAGAGAALVYQHDARAALLEWLDGPPLTSLIEDGKDTTATDIICQIVAQLHLPRATPPPALTPLEMRFETLFLPARSWPAAGRDLLVRARFIARELLETTDLHVPLHGDLHHGNVLFSPRSWLAIDPKALFGDPAYEVASAFLNPFGFTELCADHARIERMASAFASRLDMDRARLLGFAAAHAALSICWDLQAGQDAKHQLAVLPNLLAAYQRAARGTSA